MEKITVLGTQNPVGLRNAINETLGQFVPAHIVGATFSAAWLAETEGGNPLTPVVGRLYTVVTAGDYKNQLFRWNDATYEQVGRTTIDELAGGALPVTAPETETALSVAVADWVNTRYNYFYNGAARGAMVRTVLATGNFSQFRNATNFPANKFYQYGGYSVYQTREVYAEGIQPSYRQLVFGNSYSYTYIYIYDDINEYENGGIRSDFSFTQIYYDYGSGISKATKSLTNITTHSRVALTIDTADRTVANTADLYDTVDVTDGSIVLTATNLPTEALDFTVENILTSGTYTKGVIKGLTDGRYVTTDTAGIPTYAEYAVSDYDVAVLGSNGIVYIKLDTLPAHGNRYYAFVKGSILLQDGTDEYDYFVSGSVDLEEAPTAVSTYNNASVTPNIRMCTYYPEVPEFRVVTPNLNIATPITKSQTLKLCVINF